MSLSLTVYMFKKPWDWLYEPFPGLLYIFANA